MSRYRPEPRFEHDRPARIGVLLINLGTPDAPTPGAVRTYLGQFLTDPRGIEIPAALWRPLLHGVILRLRPAHSAERYRRVRTKHGSALLIPPQRRQTQLFGHLEAPPQARPRPAH